MGLSAVEEGQCRVLSRGPETKGGRYSETEHTRVSGTLSGPGVVIHSLSLSHRLQDGVGWKMGSLSLVRGVTEDHTKLSLGGRSGSSRPRPEWDWVTEGRGDLRPRGSDGK